jgi:hypothetical protein
MESLEALQVAKDLLRKLQGTEKFIYKQEIYQALLLG